MTKEEVEKKSVSQIPEEEEAEESSRCRTSLAPPWSFYRTMSSVRLCWEFEEPKGPKGRRGSKYVVVLIL